MDVQQAIDEVNSVIKVSGMDVRNHATQDDVFVLTFSVPVTLYVHESDLPGRARESLGRLFDELSYDCGYDLKGKPWPKLPASSPTEEKKITISPPTHELEQESLFEE